MNINMQNLNILRNPTLKSTQERMDRQLKRDNKIAFFEQQKENLKDMKADTLDEISRKLSMLQGYNDQIAAAKAEYNHSQMFHVLDEAREQAEKIAEEAEKYAPKTPEERREDIIEEATGAEKDEGMLDEMLDEISEFAEDMEENLEEHLEELTEAMDIQVQEGDTGMVTEELTQIQEISGVAPDVVGNMHFPEDYKRIDIRI